MFFLSGIKVAATLVVATMVLNLVYLAVTASIGIEWSAHAVVVFVAVLYLFGLFYGFIEVLGDRPSIVIALAYGAGVALALIVESVSSQDYLATLNLATFSVVVPLWGAVTVMVAKQIWHWKPSQLFKKQT